MTPHRTRGDRGNYRFDRIFPGVGRITVSAETKSKKEFEVRNALLDRLYEAGQLDVLRLLKAGKLRATELRAAQRRKRLESDSLAADIALEQRLWDGEDGTPGAITRTLEAMRKADGTPIAPASRARYETSFHQLRELAADVLGAEAKVSDLARVDWSALWRAMQTSASNRNRLRAAVSAFLTDFLGGDLYHPFRRQVMIAMGKRERERKRVTDLPVQTFWAIMDHVPEPLVPCYVTLAASGMRVGEYLQCTAADLRPASYAIHIPGGKTGEDEVFVDPALWPFVVQAIPCRITKAPAVFRGVQRDARYKRLLRYLREAGRAVGCRVTLHDLRHLFVQLGVQRMPESMVQAAARHKTPAMTRDYAMRKVKGEVARVVGRQLRPRRRA